jgi:predicted AlkP superfamily pyrophosphatase or phosphodiesterase
MIAKLIDMKPTPTHLLRILSLIGFFTLCLAQTTHAETKNVNANHKTPVVLISIDGLRPVDWRTATANELPTLYKLRENGSFAEGVVGVTPTLTYPSHVTLITGNSPAVHGVVSNTSFDPMSINQTGWYWYATDIRTQTLFGAAKKAGLKTANVHWPVTVDEQIDFSLPQIWRTGHEDDRKLLKAVSTPGLQSLLEKKLNLVYAQGIKEDLEDDLNRAKFAQAVLELKHPDFSTIYLTALDHNQHIFGPGTQEAKDVLKTLDTTLGEIIQTARKVNPKTVIFVVSDHGFAQVKYDVNLIGAFAQNGLIQYDAAGKKVTGWSAAPWFSGGSAAVILKDPSDKATHAKVKALLEQLRMNPEMGISTVYEKPTIRQLGANPLADFWIEFKLGYEMGNDHTAAPVSPSKYKGMHGYSPTNPEMQASLLISIPNKKNSTNLGTVDMRDIAPTIAKVLGIQLKNTEGKALKLH